MWVPAGKQYEMKGMSSSDPGPTQRLSSQKRVERHAVINCYVFITFRSSRESSFIKNKQAAHPKPN